MESDDIGTHRIAEMIDKENSNILLAILNPLVNSLIAETSG